MSGAASVFPQIDQEAKRRQALAKVYSFLIRLAEEAENSAILPDLASEDETKDESNIYLDPIFSIYDTN